MNLSTPVIIRKANFEINHQSKVISLGSCFADNIGKQLENHYFFSDTNPFGALYNPESVKNSIELLMSGKMFTKEDLFEFRGLWNSFSHSTLFSDVAVDKTLGKINSRLTVARAIFNQMDRLIVTFGTAWVYEEVKSGKIVANCHKLPSNCFKRYRLSVEYIVNGYADLFLTLKESTPNLEIIMSVSPIRHLKDGASENTLSKSILHLAISELEERFEFVHYFPAYEILLDELRDYRFFARDMVHPSDISIEYIWSKFSDTYFAESTQQLNKKLCQLNNDLMHRPIHIDNEEFKRFQSDLAQRKDRLMAEFPFLQERFE